MQTKKLLLVSLISICLGLCSEFTQAAPKTPLIGLKRQFLNFRGDPATSAKEPIPQPNQLTQIAQEGTLTKDQLYQGLSILVDYILVKRKNTEFPQEYADDLKLLGLLMDSYPKGLGPKIEPILRNSNTFENLDKLGAFNFIAETDDFLCLAGQKEATHETSTPEATLCVFWNSTATNSPPAKQNFHVKGTLLDLKCMGPRDICFLFVIPNKTLGIGILSKTRSHQASQVAKMILTPLEDKFNLLLSDHSAEQLKNSLTLCCYSNNSTFYITYLPPSDPATQLYIVKFFKIRLNPFPSTANIETVQDYFFQSHGYKRNKRFHPDHQFFFHLNCCYLAMPAQGQQIEKEASVLLIFRISDSSLKINPLPFELHDFIQRNTDPKEKIAFHLNFSPDGGLKDYLLNLWDGETFSIIQSESEIVTIKQVKTPLTKEPKLTFVLTSRGQIQHVSLDQNRILEFNLSTNRLTLLEYNDQRQLSLMHAIEKPLYHTQDCFYYIDQAQNICSWNIDYSSAIAHSHADSMAQRKPELRVFDAPPHLNDQPRSFHKWLAANFQLNTAALTP